MKEHRSHQEARQIPGKLDRRQFVSGALTAAASVSSLAALANVTAHGASAQAPPVDAPRKIKLGVIGNGGRGAWIAKLFQKHGGYEMHAVADYFPEVADKCGEELGVDKTRRFSALSGYKRLIESGVEAVALETPPYFFPEHACAAVDAGLHVYMAKPVAVDVPGAMAILAAGKRATEKQQCFLVDYQLPTDPHNIEIAKQIAAGAIGSPAVITSRYFGGGWPDPPRTATVESRLQHSDLVQRHRSGRQPSRQRLHSRDRRRAVGAGQAACPRGRVLARSPAITRIATATMSWPSVTRSKMERCGTTADDTLTISIHLNVAP